MHQIPKFQIKIARNAAEPLDDWLERAKAQHSEIVNRHTGLAALETKRDKVASQITKLEARADEAEAASQIPALQTQLAGIERKIEEAYAQESGGMLFLSILSELRPLLTRAMNPLIEAEISRIAEPLLPYVRRREAAIHFARQTDWIIFLSTFSLSEWRNARLETAMHVVESLLRCELPYPYAQNSET